MDVGGKMANDAYHDLGFLHTISGDLHFFALDKQLFSICPSNDLHVSSVGKCRLS